MKLIFAVLDVSLSMGLTRCYKTEGFFTFILNSSARNRNVREQFTADCDMSI